MYKFDKILIRKVNNVVTLYVLFIHKDIYRSFYIIRYLLKNIQNNSKISSL